VQFVTLCNFMRRIICSITHILVEVCYVCVYVCVLACACVLGILFLFSKLNSVSEEDRQEVTFYLYGHIVHVTIIYLEEL